MGKTLAKIIGYAAVALILVAVVGLVYKFTNGFNESFKTFYVEYEGKQILTTDNKMLLEKGKEHRFDVKYTFDNEKSEVKDYSVKVIPNPDKTVDFEYSVDDENYVYSKLQDMTKAFDITKSETYFTLNIPEGFSIQYALNKLYPNKRVSVPESGEIVNPYLYRLVISSYNGKVTYNIDFYCSIAVTDVELDKDKLFFGGAEQPTTQTSPSFTPSSEYSVECISTGDVSNLSDISVTYPRKAKVGETVTVTVNIGDKNYSISDMRISVMNSNDDVDIIYKDGSYSFTMPQGNVYFWIYFKYTPPVQVEQFKIEYDTLGNGSVLSIDLKCPDKAAAGETVTFTVSLVDLSDEFDDYYPIEITNIVLNDMETGEEILNLGDGEGTFTFTMPNTSVTIMFYLMRI